MNRRDDELICLAYAVLAAKDVGEAHAMAEWLIEVLAPSGPGVATDQRCDAAAVAARAMTTITIKH